MEIFIIELDFDDCSCVECVVSSWELACNWMREHAIFDEDSHSWRHGKGVCLVSRMKVDDGTVYEPLALYKDLQRPVVI